MATCKHCASRAENRDYRVTSMLCVSCCAESVRRARPSRNMQEQVLDALEVFRNLPTVTEHVPTREEVLRELAKDAG